MFNLNLIYHAEVCINVFLLLAPYMVYAQTDSVCCGDSVSEAWAEANKDRIAKMTRSEWLKLPTDGIRRAAYTRFLLNSECSSGKIS